MIQNQQIKNYMIQNQQIKNNEIVNRPIAKFDMLTKGEANVAIKALEARMTRG